MADRFRRLRQTLPDLVGELIAGNAPLIEDLQTAQMDAGLDSEGNAITPPYRPFTVQVKRAKGQPTDRVTLRDEGDFHRAMFLSGGGQNRFAIGNSDPKAGELLAKYGDEVLGLNDDAMQRLIDEGIAPELPGRALEALTN